MNLRSSSLRTQFIIVVALVFVFALGMAIFLNYFKFQKALGGLITSRITVIGLDLQNSMENAVALGLDLSEIQTLQPLLERQKKSDQLIQDIDVVTPSGLVLYSTDLSRLKKQIEPRRKAAMLATGGRKDANWNVDVGNASFVGVPVKNSFDLVVGYVVMKYDRLYLRSKVQGVAADLAKNAAILFAVFLVLTGIGVSFVIGRLVRDLRAVEPPLDAVGAGEPPPPVKHTDINHPLELQVAAFSATVAEASSALSDIERRLATGSPR